MILSSIETERLVLTPLCVAHAREMVTVLADHSLYEFTGGQPPTLSELEHRYQQQTAGSSTPGECWCNWVISATGSGCAIGFVQATVTGHAADLAWVLSVSSQGRGFATEAAAAVCEWLHENDVRRVEAHIHPHHLSSQAVAERLGLLRTEQCDDDGEEVWAAEL